MGLKQTTQCLGYQQITNVATSVGLTVPVGATAARIMCTGQAVRWRDDGVAPTTAIGMTLPINVELFYDGDLRRIRFIQTAATAVLDISYYN